MISVCDTSPLVALSSIGRHEILRELYGEITISPSTRLELEAALDKMHRRELLDATWLIIVRPVNWPLVTVLRRDLDAGEAEAIALTIDLKATRVILDDLPARKVAIRLDLPVIGLAGVLLEAKRKGIIHELGPMLADICSAVDFRISASLMRRVLSDAGEL